MPENEYPKAFLKRMKNVLADEYDAFISALNSEPVVSIRYNPLKPSLAFNEETVVPWCNYGRYLSTRPEFVSDPLIHAGAYYVQEASSMFFNKAIDFSRDMKIIDLCASPGGKSSLLLSLMTAGSILFSNELVGKRADILYENLCKWGYSNGIVTQNRLTDFKDFHHFFDVVLVDAPCSGEGMFRKNINAVREWSENKAFVCSVGQKDILDQAISLVKNNGLLIYSTCTFSPEENEQIVQWLYNKYNSIVQPLKIVLDESWGIEKVKLIHQDSTLQEVYKCMPHKVKGEGLFIAAFQITNTFSSQEIAGKKIREILKKPTISLAKQLDNFMATSNDYQAFIFKDKIYALHKEHLNSSAYVLARLHTLKCGTFLGTINQKNGELIPSHEFALSSLIRADLPSMEFDRNDALRYLKKMEIRDINPNNFPKGWILARYQGLNLGWLKNHGNRLNNFYPKEWVIRKTINGIG